MKARSLVCKATGVMRSAAQWGLMLIFFVILHPSPSFAQLSIEIGGGPPAQTVKADWYLDTLQHRAWHRWKKPYYWDILEEQGVYELKDCSGTLLMRAPRHEVLVSPSGRPFAGGGYCVCYERLIRLCNGSNCFYVTDTTLLGWAEAGLVPAVWEAAAPPDTVGGALAFVATSSFDNWRGSTLKDLHYWGMLRTDGTWFIEPKYDGPFKFSNGVAEVIYYGQRRRINLQGEFVE